MFFFFAHAGDCVIFVRCVFDASIEFFDSIRLARSGCSDANIVIKKNRNAEVALVSKKKRVAERVRAAANNEKC